MIIKKKIFLRCWVNQFLSYERFKISSFCGQIVNFMASIAIFNLETWILELNSNNYYLATEIEKGQKICFFFDRVTFFEQAIFIIFRAP